jgi:hypothetical protein
MSLSFWQKTLNITHIMTGIFSLSVLLKTGRLRVDPDRKFCKDEILKQKIKIDLLIFKRNFICFYFIMSMIKQLF